MNFPPTNIKNNLVSVVPVATRTWKAKCVRRRPAEFVTFSPAFVEKNPAPQKSVISTKRQTQIDISTIHNSGERLARGSLISHETGMSRLVSNKTITTEDTEVPLLINNAYLKLSQCALERQSPPRKFQHGGRLFSEKNTAKSVSRSNRWLHVTLNFVEIFLFSSLLMETGHLDMCDSFFWPFR